MMRNLKLLCLGMLLAALSACSILPRNNEPIGDDQSELVARDLSGALALLRGYSPRNTMLQLRPAKTRFGRSLEQALRAQGYGLQNIPDNDTGPMLVTYQVESFENAAGQSVGYRLRAGSVELAREYEIQGGRVFPMTGLSVKGVEIASEPYDQSIFDRNRAASQEQEQEEPERQSDERLLPNRQPLSKNKSAASVLTSRTRSLRERVFGKSEEVPAVPASLTSSFTSDVLVEAEPVAEWESIGEPDTKQRSKPSAGAPLIKRNVLEIGQSNFASVTQDYEELSTNVLVFANDSLRLGAQNKAMIGALAEQFDPSSDLLALMGCSNGPSARTNGNEHLAIGRANRVKEELILVNVSTENILDEGCWAPTAQEDLPARGVIVRVLRRTTDI